MLQRLRSGSAIFFSLFEILLIGTFVVCVVLLIPLLIPSSGIKSANQAAKRNEPIFRLSRISDGRFCVQVGNQKLVSFDLLGQNNRTEFRTSGIPLAGSQFSRDGTTFMVSLEDREFEVFRNHELLISHDVSPSTASEMSLSASGTTAILVWNGNSIRCWDLSNSDPAWTDYKIPKTVDRLALTPCGKMFVASTAQGELDLHAAKTGDLIKSLGDLEPVKSDLVFSDDGRWLAFADSQKVYLYDMHLLKIAWQVPLTPWNGPQHVAIMHDGRLVAVGNTGVGIQVLSGSSGETVCMFKPDYAHHRLEFSLSGDALYTTKVRDGSIRVWSLITGSELQPIRGI